MGFFIFRGFTKPMEYTNETASLVAIGFQSFLSAISANSHLSESARYLSCSFNFAVIISSS